MDRFGHWTKIIILRWTKPVRRRVKLTILGPEVPGLKNSPHPIAIVMANSDEVSRGKSDTTGLT